jgi:hypothetical protein
VAARRCGPQAFQEPARQLAAGRGDVAALGQAQGRPDLALLEPALETRELRLGRGLERRALDRAVGDQVDLGPEAPRDRGQAVGVVEGIVEAGDDTVFKGDHPAARPDVLLGRPDDLL